MFNRVRLVVLDPIKNMLRVFGTPSKTFLEKRVSNRGHHNDGTVNVGN